MKKSMLMFASFVISASQAWASPLPLFPIQNLVYEGAQRLSVTKNYGESRLGWANGTIAIDYSNNSIFVVGHEQHQMIAEYPLLEPVKAEKIVDIGTAAEPVQNFSPIISRLKDAGIESYANTITGMGLVNGMLIVNVGSYYVGADSNEDTTIIVKNKSDLANTDLTGFLRLEPKHHAAGWITPIPPKYQESLKGDYIVGHASNQPINHRSSIGPSAFSLNSSDLLMSTSNSEKIETTSFLDFSVSNPIADDLTNESKNNLLWTELSSAYIGLIVPGTRTYMVIGSTGGHKSGIGYKLPYGCGGWCPVDPKDWQNYYWLWDLDEIISNSKSGFNPWETLPYEYGELVLPHQNEKEDGIPATIIGASYDPVSSKLFLMLGKADPHQSKFDLAPLLLTYKIEVNGPQAPLNFRKTD